MKTANLKRNRRPRPRPNLLECSTTFSCATQSAPINSRTILTTSSKRILSVVNVNLETIDKQTMKKPGTEILPGKLYLTSIFEAQDQEFLEKHKITAVLTINNEPLKTNLNTMFLKLPDNCQSRIGDHFEKIVEFITENECVLVHCHAGVSRSATAVIAFLMHYKNWNLDEAEQFVRSKRPIICPNFSFMGQLKRFENELIIKQKVREIEDLKNLKLKLENSRSLEAEKLKILPKLKLDEQVDSGVDTPSESSNESPIGTPKNKIQKIEFVKSI